MTFANPGLLYLLILIAPMLAWYVWKERDAFANIRFSSLKPFEGQRITYRHLLRHLIFALRIMVIALVIVVLARPQSTNRWQNVTTEGIDIMIALDISGSMLAQDFKPNRLEASKNVAIEFISGRETDRMGLVVYSGESFTQCPLTTDHAVLINLFNDIESGMIEDGTAIGMGLANAVNRLKDSKAQSKVIILLTDGVNNRGAIAPLTAAEIAKSFGIRVYTIGVGTEGMAPVPVQTPYGTRYQNAKVEIDEETLKQIADATDGSYFRATNNEKLREIYIEIDKLEKTKIDVKEYSKKEEEYMRFGLLATILFLFEILVRYLIFRNIP
ncbi:MAG TPA: VWA domain-containing protein [Bacteroides sp.]|nr:VWA domain-containing protein [Bacteroides sp.]